MEVGGGRSGMGEGWSAQSHWQDLEGTTRVPPPSSSALSHKFWLRELERAPGLSRHGF